jgi:tRNA1Val (adenine37-N6)-methyltransferase
MPIGTDAVLLGAWAQHPHPTHILDIGTGSGIIALMLAQRFTNAIIDGIDIDEASITEAQNNFNQSIHSNRLFANVADADQYAPNQQYNLIVSNPPYFTQGQNAVETQRAQARHTLTLTHNNLIDTVCRLLSPDGIFCCVLPTAGIKAFILIAENNGLVVNKIAHIQYNQTKPASVSLLSFSTTNSPVDIKALLLHDANNKPTAEYTQLVSNFYLWA